MTWVYVSGPRATVLVRLERGVIVDGPPIVRRYFGRSLGSAIYRCRADRIEVVP